MLPFFQNALIGILIISVAAALVGCYIVSRRMVFISGGITHACFGGLGLGYFLGISPLACAAVFAVGGALGVDAISRTGARRDSAIAVIWALGMALGILFIFLTPGYVPELNTFLFGNVLTITRADLWLFGGFTAVLAIFQIIFHRLIVAVAFDADFARTRRLPVTFIETSMTIFVSLAIVMSIRLVGIMLLMSLISLPQMIAERFTSNYLRMLLLSLLISAAGCVGGLFAAYLINVPASAAIVLILIALYAASLLFRVRRMAAIAAILTAMAAAAPLSAEAWVMERDSFPYALVEEPAAQAGGYAYAGSSLPYYPDAEFSAVPDSLEVIFVNHVGRHGARQLSRSDYTARLLRYLDNIGRLTPIGRNVEWLCRRLDSLAGNQWGALDSLGFAEQDSIGARFFKRYPGLLEGGDSVVALASYVPRCVMSMDAMTHAVEREQTQLEFTLGSGPRFNPLVRFFQLSEPYHKYRDDGPWRKVYQDYVDTVAPVEPILRLSEAAPSVSDDALRSLALDLYKVVSGSMCIIEDIDWRPFFLESEYRELWQCANLHHYLTYSANPLTDVTTEMARPLLDDLQTTMAAAASPDYHGPKAILRFGHAETLMPLLALMNIPGCRYLPEEVSSMAEAGRPIPASFWDSVGDYWQDNEVVPMAANLQIALCRSRKSGRLYTLTYHNEAPVSAPRPYPAAT